MSQNSIILSEFVAMNETIMHKIRTKVHDEVKGFIEEMTILQLRACMLIQEFGSIKMSELAKILNLKTSGATQLIDKLVENKIVQRVADPSDRRSVIISLTPSMTIKVNKIKAIETRILSEVFEPLTLEELGVMKSLLTKII
jgi:DNA-binding MarR family transcriptional regulator